MRRALTPQALRSNIVDYIRAQGEAEVQLSEKRDVLKAKVSRVSQRFGVSSEFTGLMGIYGPLCVL